VAYSPASAREITVDDNGLCANFKSIQEAVNSSSPGDVILVYPGLYNESVDIGIQNISVFSKSGNPEDTIVRAFKLSVNNITVSGFSIQESLTLEGYDGYLYYPVENCTVKNNILRLGIDANGYNSIIEKNVILNLGIGVNSFDTGFNFTVSDNLIVKGNIYVYQGPNNCILLNNTLLNGSIGLTECGNHTILGNYVSNNQEGSGISLWESYSNEIENNTVVNCSNGISMEWLSSQNIINNNTLNYNNKGIWIKGSGGGSNSLLNNTISNNNIGIWLGADSSSNLVANNKVELNKKYGIYLNGIASTVPFNRTNRFYNNIFNNTINFFNDTSNSYTTEVNNRVGIFPVAWNTTKASGTNILGGSYLGGNYWANPDRTGFSETCKDSDGDGICDLPYNVTDNDTDHLPLTAPPAQHKDRKLILTEYQITTNESYQSNPAIYEDRIVWQDDRNGNLNIYMYDISTSREIQITTNESNQYIPDIDADNIVWNDLRNGKRNVYMYNLSTSTESRITTNTSDQWLPAIYKDKIVWIDYRNGKAEIYIYNLSTSEETQITNSESDKFDPDIYGDRLVWRDYRENSGIYMYDLSTFRETQITPGSQQSQPVICSDRIIWSDNRNGNSQIYMYNASTCAETQITTNEFNQFGPDFYEDRIVWADYRNGNWDIYMYDLSTKKETQITTNKSNQEHPAIYGDRIVWIDYRNGFENPDIYMCVISELEEKSPVADFSASPTSGYAPLKVLFTDSSTGSPTSWLWDFGDGIHSKHAMNATHTFTRPGKYNVSLTVANADGIDTETRSEYIIVSTDEKQVN
jgi:beta propeller repeat protein/parallel beta-helix repeat protein